jgi:hypothetical protein
MPKCVRLLRLLFLGIALGNLPLTPQQLQIVDSITQPLKKFYCVLYADNKICL